MEAIEERRPHEKLGDFLDRILGEYDIRLHHSRETAKNYLAVSPVLMKLFEELKEKASTMKKMKQIQQDFNSRGGGSSSNEPETPERATDSYHAPRPYQKDSHPEIQDGTALTVSDLIASITGKVASKVEKPVGDHFQLGEIDAILDMFDPHNTGEQLFYKVVSCGPDYGRCCVKRFESAPEALLLRLFLQCLLEAPRGDDEDNEPGIESLKRHLGLALDILCEHGTLDLASMIDEDIDRYVREAEKAIDSDMHLFRARAAIFLKLQDHKLGEKLGEKLGLEEFLDNLMAEEDIKLHVPPEVAKKYLTVSPVLPLWFMTLKWQSKFLMDVSKERKPGDKVQFPPGQPSVTFKKKPRRREHKRPAKSEL